MTKMFIIIVVQHGLTTRLQFYDSAHAEAWRLLFVRRDILVSDAVMESDCSVLRSAAELERAQNLLLQVTA